MPGVCEGISRTRACAERGETVAVEDLTRILPRCKLDVKSSTRGVMNTYYESMQIP